MGDLNMLNVTATSCAMNVTTSSPLATHLFSEPRIQPHGDKSSSSNSSNCQTKWQSTTCQSILNEQTVSSEQTGLRQYSDTLQTFTSTCDYKSHVLSSTSDISRRLNNPDSKNNNNSKTMQRSFRENHSTEYHFKDSTSEYRKTALNRLHRMPLYASRIYTDKLVANEQYLLSANSQDRIHKLPKSVSFSTDYTMSCSSPRVDESVDENINPLVKQDLSIVHSVALVHSMSSGNDLISSLTNTSTVQETTIYHNLAKHTAPVSAICPLSPKQRGPSQPSAHADIVEHRAPTSSSIPNMTLGEGSVNECPSPQVSDFGSDETHVSVNQQSFAQSYASLTPWTSKLTAPGYVPLPKPAPDAMPIRLDHLSNEYILPMSPSSKEKSFQYWRSKSNQVYSQIKPETAVGCYDDTISNSKMKNGCGALHVHRQNYKIMPNKEHRFRRTADALQKSGLWEVAMKTGSLMKRNRELQKELEEFRSDAVAFLKSVIKNPQNRGFIKKVLNSALTSNAGSRSGSSVMAVVVSAAAMATAASVQLDSGDSSDDSMSGNTSS